MPWGLKNRGWGIYRRNFPSLWPVPHRGPDSSPSCAGLGIYRPFAKPQTLSQLWLVTTPEKGKVSEVVWAASPRKYHKGWSWDLGFNNSGSSIISSELCRRTHEWPGDITLRLFCLPCPLLCDPSLPIYRRMVTRLSIIIDSDAARLASRVRGGSSPARMIQPRDQTTRSRHDAAVTTSEPRPLWGPEHQGIRPLVHFLDIT